MSPARPWQAAAMALATALGCALTAGLGAWQWGRAQDKLALQAQLETRRQLPALQADALIDPSAVASTPALLHRAVVLRGQWVAERTVYLDNRQMQGRPGFFVVTPLRLSGGDAVVLVQRGWIPRNFQDRARLAPVETPPGEVTVSGRIAPAPAKLYEFDGPSAGPIRQNLDVSAYRAETGLPLVEASVVQVGPASEGLLREWPLPAGGADKNYGYAFQWWALSGLILIIYVWFQFIAPRRRRSAA